MKSLEPFFREAGSGAPVVCLHANASSSSQWRALMELLAPTHHVVAPDLYGCGQSPDWPSDRSITLADEVAFIAPVVARLPAPVTLVAHSYGAAVALRAALTWPTRVSALVLYEPTLFALIDAQSPPPNQADGIRHVVTAAGAALDGGDHDLAAQLFIDYWMGAGAWANTPAHRRPAIVQSVTQVRRWGHALFTEPTPLAAWAQLQMPVLYMMGQRSTTAALGVAALLRAALPQVRTVTFEALGHMGPVTHPELVNAQIKRFLAEPR